MFKFIQDIIFYIKNLGEEKHNGTVIIRTIEFIVNVISFPMMIVMQVVYCAITRKDDYQKIRMLHESGLGMNFPSIMRIRDIQEKTTYDERIVQSVLDYRVISATITAIATAICFFSCVIGDIDRVYNISDEIKVIVFMCIAANNTIVCCMYDEEIMFKSSPVTDFIIVTMGCIGFYTCVTLSVLMMFWK